MKTRFVGYITALTALCLSYLTSCTIEPPLKLAGTQGVNIEIPMVVTDISVIWDVEADWQTNWYYGWDETDTHLWGPLEYPTPTNYEVRIYHLGEQPSAPWQHIDCLTIYDTSFSRQFKFGYHDLVFWSNIDSADGTQVLIVDESDASDIHATTSRSRLSYAPPQSRSNEVFNNPEIFYAAIERNCYISKNTEDYDYYDEERKVWVKRLHSDLNPMVYTYLVQCIIHNNKGRIIGTADNASITALADGVSIHSGITSNRDVTVSYAMRLKGDLPAGNDQHADIVGGKLTTFGLCDMQPWHKTRGAHYSGSRTDLRNNLNIDFFFSNTAEKVMTFDITDQMQAHAHGGVITVELDADTIAIPPPPGGKPGAFDPVICPGDSITEEFTL